MCPRKRKLGTLEPKAFFDEYAVSYNSDLQKGLALSGETADYFAKRRVQISSKLLDRRGITPRAILDFGCGIGTTLPLLRETFSPERLIGVDTAKEGLEIARKGLSGTRVELRVWDDFSAKEEIDFIYTNGVFHHIPVAERPSVVKRLFTSLRK